MAMVGFDSKRRQDFPDYILGITKKKKKKKKFGEDRGPSTLHNYYSPDIIVRTPLPSPRERKGHQRDHMQVH